MMKQRPHAFFFFGVFAFLSPSATSYSVDFEQDILPILEAECLDCHGPDKQKSEIRVDQRASLLKGGDIGLPSIVPGDSNASFLIEVINGSDPDMMMPPKGSPLSPEEVKLFEDWINAGAEWPGQMDQVLEEKTEHWSYLPVERPKVAVGDSINPIDAFLNAKLAEEGIEANEPADAVSLAKRVSVLLTGMIPTPEKVKDFEADFVVDRDEAYAALVDELMASPHFGERWAQHWLDVIRWAETNGSEANLYRKNAWIYRDYVVRAFNEDIPYDQFIKEQLAGDQFGVGEATGFLVAGPHVPAATVGREPSAIRQARADRIDEIMSTVGASMMGVTVSCARCHNHKFDPISITDYYAMSAVFQGVEFGGRYPEFAEDHPRRQRALEIYPKVFAQRAILRENSAWEEDWGGFKELQFAEQKTKALRIDFDWPNVSLDELEVFGPSDYNENLALARLGTILKEDESIADKRNPLKNANDGKFGTMAWRVKAPKESGKKPWVEIHFPEEQSVNRFRYSSNREYYFETDYLSQGKGGGLPSLKVSVLQDDGGWKTIAGSKAASERMAGSAKLKEASDELHRLIGLLTEEGPRHAFVGHFTEMPNKTHVMHRGSPENLRDEVEPAGFALMDGDLGLSSETSDPQRRLAFAEWLTAPDHPLTSRVMVNRIWHHLFGSGIVATGSDFGLAGAAPSHPELLDWLAAEFVDPTQAEVAPWSNKAMIRLIVMSDAFKRSSLPDEESLALDGSSRSLWRFPPQRVAAEVIRDGILLASGKLNAEPGGRSFRIHNVKKTYAQWEVIDNHGAETWRRMLYQERMRRVDDKMFTAFDFPDCGQVKDKRPVSTTPLQALNLMNSNFVVEQSRFIAERAQNESGGDKKAAVKRAFELILLRLPDAEELAASQSIAESNGLPIVCRSLINSNEFAFLP